MLQYLETIFAQPHPDAFSDYYLNMNIHRTCCNLSEDKLKVGCLGNSVERTPFTCGVIRLESEL